MKKCMVKNYFNKKELIMIGYKAFDEKYYIDDIVWWKEIVLPK